MSCRRRSREAWYDDELRPIRTLDEVLAYEAYRTRMVEGNPTPPLHPDGLVPTTYPPVSEARMTPVPPVVYISEHFSFREWTTTRQPVANLPTEAHLVAMRATSNAVLEPWRRRVGALRITSGYRSQAVNDALRRQGYHASKTSQHLKGQAADVQPMITSIENAWTVLVRMIDAGELPVDQGIVYVRPVGEGWIHVSHTTVTVPRRELLVDVIGVPRPIPWSKYSGPLSISE